MHAVMSKQRDERPNASSIDGIAYSVGIPADHKPDKEARRWRDFFITFSSHKKSPLLIA